MHINAFFVTFHVTEGCQRRSSSCRICYACTAMQILQICLFPVATIFFASVLLHRWKELTVRWSKKFAARPTIPQLPVVRLQERAVEEMRNYALTYGAAVRQRINRYGTIPGIIYQRQLQISANRINLSSAESSELKELEKEREVEIRESDAREWWRGSRIRFK